MITRSAVSRSVADEAQAAELPQENDDGAIRYRPHRYRAGAPQPA